MTEKTSDIDIPHLARLARLSLNSEETNAALADLNKIISMIDAMQAVDTSQVEPMANPLDASQRLRSDQVTELVDRDQFQAVAPETDGGYYLVPRVVE